MTKPVFSHFKLQGEWAELLFMARAAEHGLTILRPWGDSLPYDLGLVINHKSRRDGCPHPSCRAKLGKNPSSKGPGLLRIQIKSTRCRHSAGAYKCHIDSNGTPYALHQLDFIAAYVIPVQVWYILPLAATRGQAELLLAPHRPKSKYAQFKEAWHLLRNEPQRRVP